MMNANPSRMDREDEKRMLPCRYVTNTGYCHRGIRCRFYHPAPGFIRTAIKVPPLPPNFGSEYLMPPANNELHQMNGVRQGMYPMNQMPDQRMRSNSNVSNMTFGGSNSNLGNVFRRSGPNFNYGLGNRPSRSFSDFDFDFASQSSGVESSCSELSVVSNEQNTVFTHINWREFLAPGNEPPPPIKVPEEMPWTADSEIDLSSGDRNGITRSAGNRAIMKISNEDMPPEGSSRSIEESGETGKLTPREELQMKVKQIAKELALEVKPTVQVLDSYFLNFDFKAAGYSSIPPQLMKPGEPKTNGELQQVVMGELPRDKIAEDVLNTVSKEDGGEDKEVQ